VSGPRIRHDTQRGPVETTQIPRRRSWRCWAWTPVRCRPSPPSTSFEDFGDVDLDDVMPLSLHVLQMCLDANLAGLPVPE